LRFGIFFLVFGIWDLFGSWDLIFGILFFGIGDLGFEIYLVLGI
jgi:hypothetical protein